MKCYRLALGLLAGSLACAGTASAAVPSNVATYVYYSGTQIIGQSILYCDGKQQHWGDAFLDNQQNAVQVLFSCSSGQTTRVSYPVGLDPWVKANFCSTTNQCEVGPWPVNGHGALLMGYTSD